jgi:hypothetical protein
VRMMSLLANRKIGDSLLTLRAAGLLNQHIIAISDRETNENSPSLRNVVGDFGTALFNPLDGCVLKICICTSRVILDADETPRDQFQNQPQSCDTLGCPPPDRMFFVSLNDVKCDEDKRSETSQASLQESSTSESLASTEPSSCGEREFVFDHEDFPVQIETPEDHAELIEAPPILDIESFQEIVDRALPRNLRIYKWRRIFSIAKDGDLLFTMLEKCSTFKHTLMVLRTTDGHVLGGFASEKWQDQGGYSKRRSYFGTGTCFLFSSHPVDPDPSHGFSFYKWSGINDYCQICDIDSGKIAMGGGEGDFGLVIEDGFFRGTSGHCATFNNPPLIPGIDGSFEILDFEIYGLIPLIPTVSRVRSDHKFSQRSLLRNPAY